MTTTTTSSEETVKTQAERLAEPFPDECHSTMDKGGSTLTYVPVSEVITRLNNVLGVTGWEEVESDTYRDTLDPEWVISKVTLRANIDGVWTQRIGRGGQKVKQTRNGGGPVDLGDEFKGGDSDAFKKAAQKLGVALYLARGEDAIAAAQEAEYRLLSGEDLAGLAARIDKLSEENRKALAAWWKEERLPRRDGGKLNENHLKLIEAYMGALDG